MTLLAAQELIRQVCYALGFAGAVIPVVLGIFKLYHTPFSRKRKTKEVPVLTFFRDSKSDRTFPVVNIGEKGELRPVTIPIARKWNVRPGETLKVSYRTDNPTELIPEPPEKERIWFGVLQILCGVLIALFCLAGFCQYL